MANLMHPLLHISNHFGLGHIVRTSHVVFKGRGIVSHLDIRGGRDTLGPARCITGLGRGGGVVGHWESEGKWVEQVW